MTLTLEDRAALQDLLARYCMALDTKDWADFPNILHQDVVWDYSDEFGDPLHGVDAVVRTISASMDPHPASLHAPFYSRVWSTGPDSAKGYSQIISKSVLDGASLPARDETTFEVYATWSDDYLRTEDGWRIAERKLSVWATSGDAEVWDPDTIAGQAFRRLTAPAGV
jgi:hypothetical protein